MRAARRCAAHINVVNIWCSFYICAKFMCHINWWQILFSRLPVDAISFVCSTHSILSKPYVTTDEHKPKLCLPTVFLDCFLFSRSYSFVFGFICFVELSNPIFGMRFGLCLRLLHTHTHKSSLTFDFNAHILSMRRMEKKIMCVWYHLIKQQWVVCYCNFCFYLWFQDLLPCLFNDFNHIFLHFQQITARPILK